MPKNLAKVQKKIAKKKGNSNSLHENSRDAQKLRRAGARSEKLDKLAAARAKAKQPHCRESLPQMITWCEMLTLPSDKSGLLSRGGKVGRRTLQDGGSS